MAIRKNQRRGKFAGEVKPKLLFDSEVFSVFLESARLMGLSFARELSRWWRREDPVRAGMAELKAVQAENAKLGVHSDILRARLARFPARQRQHYSPEERFEILTLMNTHGLSLAETSQLFVVDPNTIARWRREALREPEKDTVGALVRANPPLRSYDDIVQRLVRMLDSYGVGGNLTIAQMLARAGIKIGRETVRRYRQRAPRRPPEPTKNGPVLRAKYSNHIWLADIIEIRGLCQHRFRFGQNHRFGFDTLDEWSVPPFCSVRGSGLSPALRCSRSL